MNNHLVRLGHAEDYDRIFEMLTRRKQFEAGEIPEQPRFVADSPATPEGERTGTPDGDNPRRAATLAALLIQTTGDDEI